MRVIKNEKMKKVLLILLIISNYCYSQTKEETISFINDKLKIGSGLYSGHYEIELSQFGNIQIHKFVINSFDDDPSTNQLHFIELFNLKKISIKESIVNTGNREHYSIRFECPEKNNCIQLELKHLSKQRTEKELDIHIINKETLKKLMSAFKHLQKLYISQNEPF